MTKRWIAVLTLLFLALGFVTLQKTRANTSASQEADKDAISKLLSQQQDAWNRGDVDAFMQAYWNSPDLTFSGSSGISRGYDGVLARYKKAYPDRAAMGQLDFSELEFHFLGPDAVLMLGKFHLKREKDEPRGTFSLVWQRFPEGWRIVHDHTTAFPEKH
jgi:beta-aspartyl-peptidase (threonine type)